MTLLEYLAEVLEPENNRAWEGWAKSPLHDAPLVWREDVDDGARAMALPEAALSEVGRSLEEYSRLP